MSKELSLKELFESLQQKIKTEEKGSYTAELAKGGAEKITRKIGEEAIEVVVAAFLNEQKKTQKTHDDLVGEVCDLFYHTLVLLAAQKIEFSEILSELNKRNQKKK
jgi:phosphoribosyl-ATP pyrophosphohydrolase